MYYLNKTICILFFTILIANNISIQAHHSNEKYNVAKTQTINYPNIDLDEQLSFFKRTIKKFPDKKNKEDLIPQITKKIPKPGTSASKLSGGEINIEDKHFSLIK